MLFSNGDKHMSVKSWEVSNALWEIVEPLIPTPRRDKEKQYRRKVGGGRKPLDSMLKNSFRRQSQKLTSPSSWP